MKGQREEMRVDELLSAYIDGALTPGERARLEARLAAEPALREQLDALQETVMLLRQLPPLPAPRNFILTPAMVRPAQPSPARQPLRWLAPALSMATAASALLLVIVLAISLLGGREAAPTVAMRRAQVDATQVAEMPAPEVGLPEAAAIPPSAAEEYDRAGAAEGAVTDTTTVTLPVRVALATPPATEEAEVQMLLAPEEAPEEGSRGFEAPLPTEVPAFALPSEAPAVPWLPLGGLGLLTLALGLASAMAWRSRRR